MSGTSKQLGTVIEGESLLNDGVAIVIFNVLLDELNPTVTRTGKEYMYSNTIWLPEQMYSNTYHFTRMD